MIALLTEDSQKWLERMLWGLKDIYEILGTKNRHIEKSLSLLSGKKIYKASQKKRDSIAGFNGRKIGSQEYINLIFKHIFSKNIQCFYNLPGGERKYGQQLRRDLKEVASELQVDLKREKKNTQRGLQVLAIGTAILMIREIKK